MCMRLVVLAALIAVAAGAVNDGINKCETVYDRCSANGPAAWPEEDCGAGNSLQSPIDVCDAEVIDAVANAKPDGRTWTKEDADPTWPAGDELTAPAAAVVKLKKLLTADKMTLTNAELVTAGFTDKQIFKTGNWVKAEDTKWYKVKDSDRSALVWNAAGLLPAADLKVDFKCACGGGIDVSGEDIELRTAIASFVKNRNELEFPNNADDAEDEAPIWKLSKIEFHWGRNMDEGSEHFLEGRQRPMEAHFIHFDSNKDKGTGYGDLAEALDSGKDSAVLVVAQLYKIADQNEAVSDSMEAITAKAPACEADGGKEVEIKIGEMINKDTAANGGGHYVYKGRMTSPTCAGHITWVVMKGTLPIKSEMLEVFRKIKGNVADTEDMAAHGNFRSLQPRGGRKVYRTHADVNTLDCISEDSPVLDDTAKCLPPVAPANEDNTTIVALAVSLGVAGVLLGAVLAAIFMKK